MLTCAAASRGPHQRPCGRSVLVLPCARKPSRTQPNPLSQLSGPFPQKKRLPVPEEGSGFSLCPLTALGSAACREKFQASLQEELGFSSLKKK